MAAPLRFSPAIPVALLLLGTALLAGCTAPAATEAVAGGAEGSGTPVTIKNFQFQPAELRVKAGTKVVWTNQDEVMHTVTSDDDAGPLRSRELFKGDRYVFTFTEPGTYAYHCMPHAGMGKDGTFQGQVGRVVVEA